MHLPEPMTVAATLLVLLVIATVLIRRFVRPQTAPAREPAYEALPAFLTPAERSFFGVLQQAVGSEYQIFAKVRLAEPGIQRH